MGVNYYLFTSRINKHKSLNSISHHVSFLSKLLSGARDIIPSHINDCVGWERMENGEGGSFRFWQA